MANALTIGRIALSLMLLVTSVLSPAFLMTYTLAGVTDMLDGYIARRSGTESELGAQFDSIADCILVAVCLMRILPTVFVPTWLWAWIALIVIVKVSNVVRGFLTKGRLVMPHTTANKLAGFATFLVPFVIPLVGVIVPAGPACVIATFAALQEHRLTYG